MALTRPSSDFVATTLNGALAAGAVTATVGTGLSIPDTNSYLQIDFDSTTAVGSDNGPETIFYAAYNTATGALTGIVRGQAGTTDVAHANGAKVQCTMSAALLEGFVGARAYLTSTLGTTVDGAWTKVALDGETYDVGANFASNKFTAPVNGYYKVTANIEYNNTVADKMLGSAIYVDGVAVAYHYAGNGGATGTISSAISDTIYVAASSYIELYYYHNCGVTTPDVVGGASVTWMTVTLDKEV